MMSESDPVIALCPEDLAWFHQARYGMFIHWGAYSVAGRGEWALNRERIPFDEYTEKYVNAFKAEHYDPAQWASLAKDAGMKYVVLTTRHHDGFCLWDTKTTDFNAVNIGPERDLIRPFADAVRDAGLKLGFYYSVADWRHPDYPGAYFRDWPSDWPDEAARQRFVQYYHAQLEELMTRYGQVDLLWYDGCIPSPTDGQVINTRIKQLQPGILINDRNSSPCDFKCCEQAIKPAPPGVAWEACMTLNDSWGYHAGDHDWKNPAQVLRMLIETASNAGNLLLNVGPRSDGTIPEESRRILKASGDWLKRNGSFLPDSTRSPFTWNSHGWLTTRGNHVYIHLFHSVGEELCLAEIRNPVLSAKVLASGQSIPFEKKGDRLFLRDLPAMTPADLAVTLELEVEGEPEPITPQTSFWIPG